MVPRLAVKPRQGAEVGGAQQRKLPGANRLDGEFVKAPDRLSFAKWPEVIQMATASDSVPRECSSWFLPPQ